MRSCFSLRQKFLFLSSWPCQRAMSLTGEYNFSEDHATSTFCPEYECSKWVLTHQNTRCHNTQNNNWNLHVILKYYILQRLGSYDVFTWPMNLRSVCPMHLYTIPLSTITCLNRHKSKNNFAKCTPFPSLSKWTTRQQTNVCLRHHIARFFRGLWTFVLQSSFYTELHNTNMVIEHLSKLRRY